MTIDELEGLAVERPEKTVEFFPPNDFYGYATVIKRYCGLDPNFVLPGVHPHGPSLNDFVWDYEINHPLPNFLLASEHQREIYSKASTKRCTVIGSPLYYALRSLDSEVRDLKQNASGTIVFPFHSTHHVTAHYDENAFLEYLKALPVEFEPVRICMYWRDVQLGRHHKFIDAGFQCVTAGHIFDHEFIYRLVRILAAHRRCVTNEIGTCVLYAAAMGLPVNIYRQDYSLAGENQKFLEDASTKANLPLAKEFLDTMEMALEQAVPIQRRLAEEALGYESLISGADLKSLLEQMARENQPEPVTTPEAKVAEEEVTPAKPKSLLDRVLTLFKLG